MIRFAIRALMLVMLWTMPATALPGGILVRENADGDCCAERLELTADAAAFYWQGRDPIAGTVHEVGGKLQVEVSGETHWVLSPDGEKWIDQDFRHS